MKKLLLLLVVGVFIYGGYFGGGFIEIEQGVYIPVPVMYYSYVQSF